MPDGEERTERLAFAAWAVMGFGEVTEPLESAGGVLDPRGWCMRAAHAIASGQPLPPSSRDRPPSEVLRERILAEAEGRSSSTKARSVSSVRGGVDA